jgi:hypothetical protein
LSTGVTYGQQYCDDYYEYEASWGDQELLKCYKDVGIYSSKEFCDSSYEGEENADDRLKCYVIQDVP